jgi:glycosyltransferase involved in cell wall biosynthesis
MPTCSLIITTYNWPDALDLVLDSVADQSWKPDEVIIADDGSDEQTKALIAKRQQNFPCPLQHVWQEDKGFRAARIRNKAIAASTMEYLVFIDGDCLLPQHFIQNHQQLSRQGYFVAGNRVLLSQGFTGRLFEQPFSMWKESFWKWSARFLQRDFNRWVGLLSFPLGPLRRWQPKRWQGVKTCNLGVFRQDLIHINGFDEAFEGWGYEDSDLVVRLIKSGVFRIDGRLACNVFHCWHQENARHHENENWERFLKRKTSRNYFASTGLIQYSK